MNPTSTDGINMAKDGEMLLIIAILPNIFKIKLNPKPLRHQIRVFLSFYFFQTKIKKVQLTIILLKWLIEVQAIFSKIHKKFFSSLSGPV